MLLKADIATLLQRLEGSAADDLETETLEFKPWNGHKDDLRVAVEYAVCFANAEGGVIVFDDSPYEDEEILLE